MPTTCNLAMLIFEDAEELDFCGPFEVFSVARTKRIPVGRRADGLHGRLHCGAGRRPGSFGT